MQTFRTFVLCCALIALGTQLHVCAAPPVGPVKIERFWWGAFKGQGQAQVAPKDHFIATRKEWAKLWKNWRGQEKLPAVDFTSQVVIVVVEKGISEMALSLDADGDLDMETGGSEANVDGLPNDYYIAVISREGVKSLLGNPIRPGAN